MTTTAAPAAPLLTMSAEEFFMTADMGLFPMILEEDPSVLLTLPAESLAEAMKDDPELRTVVHRGLRVLTGRRWHLADAKDRVREAACNRIVAVVADQFGKGRTAKTSGRDLALAAVGQGFFETATPDQALARVDAAPELVLGFTLSRLAHLAEQDREIGLSLEAYCDLLIRKRTSTGLPAVADDMKAPIYLFPEMRCWESEAAYIECLAEAARGTIGWGSPASRAAFNYFIEDWWLLLAEQMPKWVIDAGSEEECVMGQVKYASEEFRRMFRLDQYNAKREAMGRKKVFWPHAMLEHDLKEAGMLFTRAELQRQRALRVSGGSLDDLDDFAESDPDDREPQMLTVQYAPPESAQTILQTTVATVDTTALVEFTAEGPPEAAEWEVSDAEPVTAAREVLPANDDERFLPDVREGNFLIPNILVRSAVVAVGARGKNAIRAVYTEKNPLVLKNISGWKRDSVEITYVGEQLRVGDMEAFGTLLTLAGRDEAGKPVPMGRAVTITLLDMLKRMRRSPSSLAYKGLQEQIVRLQRAQLCIHSSDKAFIAHVSALFPNDPSVKSAGKTGFVAIRTHLLGGSTSSGTKMSVEIPTLLRTLLGTNYASWVKEDEYYKIPSDTARRLYLLYKAHSRDLWAQTLPELREILGSAHKEEHKFRAAVNRAHDELKVIGWLTGWEFRKSERRDGVAGYVLSRPQRAKVPAAMAVARAKNPMVRYAKEA